MNIKYICNILPNQICFVICLKECIYYFKIYLNKTKAKFEK